MLTIQRASAGSGKTYTLAKNYIRNIIGYKTPENTWKLRNNRQIEDALQHILAITFTNKATNEMKQRILNNLMHLSKASDNELTEKLIDSIPYLRDFHELFNKDYQEIGKASAFALKTILNNYSSFKISTIDSFFQEILRTFAFEANLNDSYQLELDSTFVTDAAIDSAIHELDTNPSKMGNAIIWFKILMKDEARKSQAWNPFNKRNSSQSIYARLKNALSQLEKEDFKTVKETLDNYFSDSKIINELPHVYFTLRDKALEERDNKLKLLKQKLRKVEDIIFENGYTDREINKNFLSQLKKITLIDKNTDKFNFKIDSYLNASVFKAAFKSEGNPLDEAVFELYSVLADWIPADSYYKAWLVYGPLLPYLGLLMEVKAFLKKVLKSNNLIQLSETSYILKKIIGKDDAPFVYERLGTRINNFLIDEFQDTSRMQWHILNPLLNEGLAQNNDSLIIGDPKQSIYRFRNADHRLITSVVPQTYPDHILAGNSIDENTNWRSHTEIVNFNNNFFQSLAAEIANLSLKQGGTTDFIDLYSNVVQTPHNKQGKGYVEVRIFQKPDISGAEIDSGEEEEKTDWFIQQSLENVPVLISSLLERGYRQKDICVLVNTNDKGKLIVKSLINFNENVEDPSKRIDFLSEESLLVAFSPAVETIIGVISKIANPSSFSKQQDELSGKKDEKSDNPRYYNWNAIKTDFNIFAAKHPEISQIEKVMLFLNQDSMNENFSAFIESLPTPTLTSLVEKIVSVFLDESLKKSEALYIASFQDLVTEFSANYQDDPQLFLEWWYSRGCRMSIASPEGTNAVQIMTIHKSKGLEFKCVIIPFATDSFTYLKEEWRWVKPYNFHDLELPRILPILTSSVLKGSIHEEEYSTFFDQVLTDKLNMYYVAFTRAKNELYIFTKEAEKAGASMFHFLVKILTGKAKPEEYTLQYGSPLSSLEIKEEIIKENKEESKTAKIHFFENYSVNKKQPRLISKASTVLPSGEIAN